jgi:hypothetical protein
LDEIKLGKIILCEGNEKWFLDEIADKKLGIPSRIVDDFWNFQGYIRTLSRGHPVGYPNPEIFILPLYPEKRGRIYVYRKIVGQIPHLLELAKIFKIVKILVVLDEDEESLNKIITEFKKVLDEKKICGIKLDVEIKNNTVSINFRGYTIQYVFFVVPKSYEIQLFKKFKRLYPSILNDVHEEDDGIGKVCLEFYSCDKEKLHRSSVTLFEDDEWFKKLIELIKEG